MSMNNKMMQRLLGIRAPHLQMLRLFSSEIISDNDHHQHQLSEMSQNICNTIRSKARWEKTLLSQYPQSLLFDPSLINLILSSPSITTNPLLCLRYLRFLSNSQQTIRPTTCLLKCLDEFLSLLFANNASIDSAYSAFSEITTAFKFNPSLQTWNSALLACLRADRTDLVSNLYRRMIASADTMGDEATAGYLIQALCKEEKLLDAYRTLRAFSRYGILPDVASISILVGAFARLGNYGKVSELLHLMIAGKRMPDVYTYQVIIHGLCDNGMGDEGFRIFNELKLRGYAIDVVTYSTMINGLCKMRRMDEANQLWLEMVEKGMQPNRFTYCAVIDGYFKCGDLEHAKKLYGEMVEKRYGENTVGCNIVIHGLCLNGKVDEAISVFKDMISKGIEKDLITYNILIQGLCKEGRIVEAMGFYSEVLKFGLQPMVSTYTPLILALCNQGNVTDAIKLVNHMKDSGLEPLVSTNDCIIISLCEVGKVEEGLNWLVEMLEKNLRPRPETFNKLVEYLSLAGRIDDVLPVLNAMFEIGCSLGSSVCCLLVDKLCGVDGRLPTNKLLDEILLTVE